MDFAPELTRTLPADIPQRDRLIANAARHLHLIAEANEYMNLTRITDAREAAIKHVYDSVLPWQHFADARRVMDVGTGAGFPGIPLAIVLPQTRFALVESVAKKARFLDTALEALDVPNATVFPQRAEELIASQKPDVITARAVAPMSRLMDLFGKFVKNGTRLLLYKGPDVEAELAEAVSRRMQAVVLSRYVLPDGMGERTLIELRAAARSAAATPRRQATASPR